MPIVGNKIKTTTDNFANMVRGGYLLVDKTLMIKDFLEDPNDSLILRPRRSGKSLNMSMMHYFLAAKVAGESTKGLFDHLSIAKEDKGKFLSKHQGQYPVIFITFKDAKELSFSSTISKLRVLIQELYREHIELNDQALFQKYLDGSVSDEQLQQSLVFLSECIYRAYGKKSIILIDEYDSPLTCAYQYGFLDPLSIFMRNMFSAALKGNRYLEKGLMTGILRVSKNELLSGMNNVKNYTLFNEQYDQYFGFTEDEVLELIQKTGTNTPLEEIKQFYNGYRFGDKVMYNAWSLMNFLDEKRLAPYWVLTSSDKLLKELFLKSDIYTKNQMSHLMQGECVTGKISMKTSYEELMEKPDALWTLLLFAGYLTANSKKQEDDDFICQLSIPNREILAQYNSIFKQWLSEEMGDSQYRSFISYILNGDVENFTLILGKYLIKSLSFRDVVGDEKAEKFYHGFVAGLTASISEAYSVKSNKESGHGLYDIMIIQNNGYGERGIIIEFKHAKKSESLKDETLKAIKQIDSGKYETELFSYQHIEKVLKVGMAFSGKAVFAAYKEKNLITHEETELKWVPSYSQDDC